MMAKIGSFTGRYSFLSNFYPAPVDFDEVEYPTVEHAYHAAKTESQVERTRIRKCPSPGEAKRVGRLLTLRRGWEAIKVQVMSSLVMQKFARHEELKKWLLDTGDAELVEGNHWHDAFWGVPFGGEGLNWLGRILMETRDELRKFREMSVEGVSKDVAFEFMRERNLAQSEIELALRTIAGEPDDLLANDFGGLHLEEKPLAVAVRKLMRENERLGFLHDLDHSLADQRQDTIDALRFMASEFAGRFLAAVNSVKCDPETQRVVREVADEMQKFFTGPGSPAPTPQPARDWLGRPVPGWRML